MATTVTIGGVVLTQQFADDKTGLAGPNYPMYGVKKNVPKNKSPKFSMSHLSAIIALEIVNNGAGGNIVIKDAQIEATEEIVGDFTVDLLGASGPTFTKGSNVSKIARVELTNAANVTYGNSATLYLAVKPFDASNKDLKINVNGSTRTVKMPANTVFRAGTLTRLRVPIEAPARTVVSDALEIKSMGEDDTELQIIDIKGRQTTATINGKENVGIYVLGEAGEKGIKENTNGIVTVKGLAKDMLNAIPAGFYASTWNNKPAAMTIKSLNIWLPEYGTKEDGSLDYANLQKRSQMALYSFLKYVSWLPALLGLNLYDGLQRNELTLFIDPNTISFNGIVANGYFDNDNVVIMDENTAYKDISTETINSFLGKRFVYNGNSPTVEGLKAIVNAEFDDSGTLVYEDDSQEALANYTATLMYNKMINVNTVGELVGYCVTSSDHMLHIIRDMIVEVAIQVYPHASTYSVDKKGKDNSKFTTGEYNPIILWGIDATTK